MKTIPRALRPLAAPLFLVALLQPNDARAQKRIPGIALDQLEPAPSGDPFYGVPSPFTSGHLTLRTGILFDYAYRPLHLRSPENIDPVSDQGFMRLDASLALWDRLSVSAHLPIPVLQRGDASTKSDYAFPSMVAGEFGDLRLGARARLFGQDGSALQVALGGYIFLPTGREGSYAAEGAVRGAPHLALGGRLGKAVPVVWTFTPGVVLRASDNPHTFTLGAGTAALFARERLQIGPELYASIPIGGNPLAPKDASAPARASTPINAEVLLGGRYRFQNDIVVGAAAGPGLSTAAGTPTFRAVALLAWSPPLVRKAATSAPGDRDGDGIADAQDACPGAEGFPNKDRTRHGCPPGDRDGDGVADRDDACPEKPGDRSTDPTLDGCPPDRDRDRVADAEGACPDTRGLPGPDPAKNGCPPDRDADGIADGGDACPDIPGSPNDDRAQNGCPIDPDGDGIPLAEDACPAERGRADADPKHNGCPRYVRLQGDEIVLLQEVHFINYGKMRNETVDPISDEVLAEVRDLLLQHSEIVKLEIRGHTDDVGSDRYNEWLAQERAESVFWWLVDAGVPKNRLTPRSFGPTDPMADNRTAAGRQKNRRVQLFVVERKP